MDEKTRVRFGKAFKKAADSVRAGELRDGRFRIKSRLNENGLKLSPLKRAAGKKRRLRAD
jgi:hypothetical protein